jgi:hypothetical protein
VTGRLDRRVVGGIGLLGAALLIAGSLLPWVGGPDAGTVVFGTVALKSGTLGLGSRAGLPGHDGVLTLACGIVAGLAAGLVTALRWAPGWQRWLLFGTGLFALCWAWLDWSELGDTAGADGTRLRLSAGLGLPLVVLGAAALLLAGALLGRDHHHDLIQAGLRAGRTMDRTETRQAIELQQRSIASAAANLPADDPYLALEWLRLAGMLAATGRRDRAVRALVPVAASIRTIAGDRDVSKVELGRRVLIIMIAAPPLGKLFAELVGGQDGLRDLLVNLLAEVAGAQNPRARAVISLLMPAT